MHPLVSLARETVEAYVREGRLMSPPQKPEGVFAERAGVFVSLKKHGELRGCIGTFAPSTACVAEEVIRNAIAAATQDPRFEPVAPDELESLDYSVDVLTQPEPVEDPESELDPKRYGVIVSKGYKRGLLLPALDGVDSTEHQLSIAMMKAGIAVNERGVKVQRFEVRRYR